MIVPFHKQDQKGAVGPSGKLRILGFVLLTAVSVPAARAACGDVSGMQGPFEFLTSNSYAPALQREVAAAARNSADHSAPVVSIVGMWKFQVASSGNTAHSPSIPDGASIDSGYSQWHSDGNEFSTSAPHSPASGNICMGVWQSLGSRVYQLNHFALGFDATGTFSSTVQIHQTVTISPGGTMYTGTYIIDVYDVKGNHIDHINGLVTATRLTVDSPV